MFDAKEKNRLEWTRMYGNKRYQQTIFRVLKSYKNSLFIGFILGVSLVISIVLVGQVVGKENIRKVNKSIIPISEEVELKNWDGDVPIHIGVENNESIDTLEEPDEASPSESIVDSSSDDISTFDKKYFTVLLIGEDRRVGQKTMSNTDTLLMASINTTNGKVALLSIPRDTQVMIPGYGKEKINAAARLGKGLRTTEDLVEGLTGRTIDGYVLTNFSGFKTVIDCLGGIIVKVEKDMYYVTGDKADGVINLHKGTQRLNGAQALQYARFRQDALGDITRTTRQQAVIKAIQKEFLQIKTVPKLPSLMAQLVKAVETDLSIGQLWSLSNLLLRYERLDIISQTLPGNFLIENNISYWKVNPQKTKVVVDRLLDEGKTTSVFFNNGSSEKGP